MTREDNHVVRITPDDESIEFEMNHELDRQESREISRRVQWAREQREAATWFAWSFPETELVCTDCGESAAAGVRVRRLDIPPKAGHEVILCPGCRIASEARGAAKARQMVTDWKKARE